MRVPPVAESGWDGYGPYQLYVLTSSEPTVALPASLAELILERLAVLSHESKRADEALRFALALIGPDDDDEPEPERRLAPVLRLVRDR